LNIPVLIAIAIVAALYSSVGHGGATGYLAILSLLNVPPREMASTALILNCLTASISLASYSRAGFLSWRLTWPFLIASVPCAFFGAMVKLSEQQYAWLLGSVLIFVAARLGFYQPADRSEPRFIENPKLPAALAAGAILGFLSGAVGIGGGVFLSPLIILMGWADTKTTSASAALFIIANSISGLLGRALAGTLVCQDILPYLIFGLVGALAGSYWGVRLSTGRGLRRVLAVVLIIASAKMFIPHA